MRRNAAALKRLVQRRTKRTIAPYMADRTLADKMLALRPIAFGPLWEPVGTTGANSVQDISGYNRHATPTAVTFGAAGIDGRTAAYFGGTASINVYSAALGAAVDGDVGTMGCCIKVANAGVWTDGKFREFMTLRNATGEYLYIGKNSANNTLDIRRAAGGGIKFLSAISSSVDWLSLIFVWNQPANYLRLYVNGIQSGADTVGALPWAGAAINQAVIGDGMGAQKHHGYAQYCFVSDRAFTPTEVASIGVV